MGWVVLFLDFGLKANNNTRSHIFYRWFNEFPVLILAAIVILVVVRPF
ncbi:Protoporphyrinogen IX oxidase, novel form, HemJ (EC [Bathymodiolus thermophilus thioautotrophic gill symbiont]|uniref:Protoporphyrinogen IX oxidase, novel form, HemJ (EC) n=1 Tax=Bathymodiolus thermophilus thioautotrophic gill symbiont TaxID=2360 RepID=A0ABM8M6Y2_9GAMM|nr:Protoporphyrinogen IX oxidase, novel form, HemJ (EC [Bathymodiolus thermophilus thioautotrophic gill symbiont]